MTNCPIHPDLTGLSFQSEAQATKGPAIIIGRAHRQYGRYVVQFVDGSKRIMPQSLLEKILANREINA